MNNVVNQIFNRMNKILIYSLFLVLITMSCDINKKNKQQISVAEIENVPISDSDGLSLIQQKCYICHSVTSESHDNLLAPPLEAIKRRYKMTYPTKDEFVEAITNWVVNPVEEDALMRGAVQNFNVMPNLMYNKEEVKKMATYIYNNELETPIWFELHFNEEHPNGMGNGNGRGKGRGRNF